jgi:hypothetical protein
MGASVAADGERVNEIGYGLGASEAPEEQEGRRCASSCSADHLVGLEQHRRRDGKPEDLGGLEVEDQLELRWLL